MSRTSTPWIKSNSSSSLVSDRIKSRPSPPPNSSASAKGKGKSKQTTEPPKSAEVRRLEALIRDLRENNGSTKDPKGGCFCLGVSLKNSLRDELLGAKTWMYKARVHPVSPHSPLCLICGLVLCDLNPPYNSCPSCLSPLLSQNSRDTLLARLDAQLAQTLDKEENERIRIQEQQRQAVGAFPTLTGAPIPLSVPKPQVPQQYKVLSLNSKTKKAMITTVRPSPPSSSATTPNPKPEEVDEGPVRVPPPPHDVAFSKSRNVDPARPYENFVDSALLYVPATTPQQPKSSRRKGGKKSGNRDDRGGEGGKGKVYSFNAK